MHRNKMQSNQQKSTSHKANANIRCEIIEVLCIASKIRNGDKET
jgi:hypothetical protein